MLREWDRDRDWARERERQRQRDKGRESTGSWLIWTLSWRRSKPKKTHNLRWVTDKCSVILPLEIFVPKIILNPELETSLVPVTKCYVWIILDDWAGQFSTFPPSYSERELEKSWEEDPPTHVATHGTAARKNVRRSQPPTLPKRRAPSSSFPRLSKPQGRWRRLQRPKKSTPSKRPHSAVAPLPVDRPPLPFLRSRRLPACSSSPSEIGIVAFLIGQFTTPFITANATSRWHSLGQLVRRGN